MQLKDEHSLDRNSWAVRRCCDATIISLASLASEDPYAVVGFLGLIGVLPTLGSMCFFFGLNYYRCR